MHICAVKEKVNKL